MIDTWLTAAVLLALLTAGALIRLIRARGQNDRFLAALLAVTFGAAAGVMAGIGTGTALVLDLTLAGTLICCSGLLVSAHRIGGPGA